MANTDDRLKVYLREVDYYSNPEVVVVVARSIKEAEEMYQVLEKISHEKLINRPNFADAKRLFAVYLGIWDMFVLRPEVHNRNFIHEPRYPTLIQEGPAVKEYPLRVFLNVQSDRRSFGDGQYDIATIPEVAVITSPNEKEAQSALSEMNKSREGHVRTAFRPGSFEIEGEWIEVNQSIHQSFILRPRGNADMH